MLTKPLSFTIAKSLSSNDIGLTGGHQSGILIPKRQEILSFFPMLDSKTKNPRCILRFMDDSNHQWEFAFIYYNNLQFGGTRNEYRLTRMTKYLRVNNLNIGDEILLTVDEYGQKFISHKKIHQQGLNIIKLSSDWKVINF